MIQVKHGWCPERHQGNPPMTITVGWGVRLTPGEEEGRGREKKWKRPPGSYRIPCSQVRRMETNALG